MPYTFRSDVHLLHQAYGGNATEEDARFYRMGCDGAFTDFTGHARHARDVFYTYGAEEITFLPDSAAMTAASRINHGAISAGDLVQKDKRRRDCTLLEDRRVSRQMGA